MIGVWAEHAGSFLLGVVGVTALLFAVPLFLVPLQWARIMRFTLPDDTDLAVYFGRCLGAVALGLVGLGFHAARTGAGLPLTYALFFGVAVLMVGVHVYGAIRRIQPLSETLEIGFWLALALLLLAFFPSPAGP